MPAINGDREQLHRGLLDDQRLDRKNFCLTGLQFSDSRFRFRTPQLANSFWREIARQIRCQDVVVPRLEEIRTIPGPSPTQRTFPREKLAT